MLMQAILNMQIFHSSGIKFETLFLETHDPAVVLIAAQILDSLG